MSKTRRDTLELLCDLTDSELIERARTGAHARAELVKLENVKKAWANEHGEQVKAYQGLMARMADCAFTGKEMRLVNCVTHFHQPSVGMKTVVRTDTYEVVREVAMDQHELQENLFEKPEEEESAATQVGAEALPASVAEAAEERIAGAMPISQACSGGAHVSCELCGCDCHDVAGEES